MDLSPGGGDAGLLESGEGLVAVVDLDEYAVGRCSSVVYPGQGGDGVEVWLELNKIGV